MDPLHLLPELICKFWNLKFTRNFFIFLKEDLTLHLIQLLLLIFSKRLDNLLSVCGAFDLQICIPSSFSLLYFLISSRIGFFFKTLAISFLSAFLPFLSFCFQIKNVKNLKFLYVSFRFYLHLSLLFHKNIYYQKRIQPRFSLQKFCRSSIHVTEYSKFIQFSSANIFGFL